MEHFLPLFALGPARYPDQVRAFLRLGKIPHVKAQAAETLLAAKGNHRNALWLLLVPYGFTQVRNMEKDQLRTALAVASEVRATFMHASTPALQQALAVLRRAAAELVPGYRYGNFATPLGQKVAAATLTLASRTEELGAADYGCVNAAVLMAAMDGQELDGIRKDVQAMLGLSDMVQHLLRIVKKL